MSTFQHYFIYLESISETFGASESQKVSAKGNM